MRTLLGLEVIGLAFTAHLDATRIMARNRLWLVVVALLAPGWSPPSLGQTIRFAQITDAHIFDSEGKAKGGALADSRGENERGLRWAIDEINRRDAAGPGYDFVVFTGDFGLEKLAHPVLGDLDRELDRAAEQFAAFLDRSNVRTWLMVPGNNDLVKEDPRTIKNFHTFISLLQAKVGSRKSIRDFAPQGTPEADAVYSLANCHFFGFDNASFKSNADKSNTNVFEPYHRDCLKRLDKNLKASRKAWEVDTNNRTNFFAYIFCHIPNVYDPHDNPQGNRVLTWWVHDSVRDDWGPIVKATYVKGVFAGHLHDFNRKKYECLDWTRNPPVNCPAANLDKLLICPPIAVKYQMDKEQGQRARGFRDVHIDTKTGEIIKSKSEIAWLD
jgi:3',5'-cyclic AMP phosphodiesterase CpdA